MNANLVKDVREGINMRLAPLSIDQYHRMIDNGILEDGEPIELIEGALIYKDRRDDSGGIMTHGARHLRVLNKLMALLSQWVASRTVFLQVQGPIVVSETSEPEPDCCLVRGTPDDYAEEVPQAADVLAVFEVAHSSLRSDRRTKQRLYATAGIPCYVIVNLQDNVIEVLSEPTMDESRYTAQSEYRQTEMVVLSLGPHGQLSFSANDLL
jgi:Uma2 family endonuclease